MLTETDLEGIRARHSRTVKRFWRPGGEWTACAACGQRVEGGTGCDTMQLLDERNELVRVHVQGLERLRVLVGETK